MVLIVEKKSKILYLTLNRPERANSLDPDTLIELRNEFIEAQKNDKIKVIVLSASGEKDFCTGIDVNTAADFNKEAKTNLANVAGDIATMIYSGKPVVVGINGRAMGMGIVFAAAADYRIMVENCSWQMPEVTVGIYPGASCIAIFSRVCGTSWTRRILMTGDKLGTNDALQANIADEIVSQEDLKKRIKKIARKFSLYNPIALKSIKYTTISMPYLKYDEGIELETKCADYYTWNDPEDMIKKFNKEYDISFPLTGDPEKLRNDAGI